MKKLVLAGLMAIVSATAAFAEGMTHYLAIHVDQNDPAVMNLVLNNVQNVKSYYASVGDDVVIEVVAYGPGLNMYVADKSPVATRIAAMSLEMGDGLSFSACGNTMKAMAAKTGADVVLLDEAHVVPAGVIRLMELQDEGYAYIKP